MQSKVLGMEGINLCGCGCPSKNIELIYKLLKAKSLASEVYDSVKKERGSATYGKIHDAYKKAVHDTLQADPEATLELAMQLIDGSSNFLEHGGSIHGSWLTESGVEFVRQVEQADPAVAEEYGADIRAEVLSWAERLRLDMELASAPHAPARPKRV